MELKTVSEDKNVIEIKMRGENHTFCNLIRKELTENEDVEAAAYKIDHPLVSSPVLLVQTSKGTPKKALQLAIDSLRKKTKEYRSVLSKAL